VRRLQRHGLARRNAAQLFGATERRERFLEIALRLREVGPPM
jgi:hypothetical protein